MLGLNWLPKFHAASKAFSDLVSSLLETLVVSLSMHVTLLSTLISLVSFCVNEVKSSLSLREIQIDMCSLRVLALSSTRHHQCNLCIVLHLGLSLAGISVLRV